MAHPEETEMSTSPRYTVRETKTGLLDTFQVFDNWTKAGRAGHRSSRALVQRHADALNAETDRRKAEIIANTHKLPEGYTCQRPACPVHARRAVVRANAWATRVLVPVIDEAVGRC